MTRTDTLADLDFVSLQERLARFLGAVHMEDSPELADEKLRELQLACRAADLIIKTLSVPRAAHVRALLAPKAN